MVLHFREQGAGDPLVILHGVFGSLSNWNAIARRLSGAYRVFTLDLRNHGRSPHAVTMHYPEMAADAAEFMTSQGLDRVPVIGHSMGGKVAMMLALTHPALLRGLVVLDIAPVTYPDRFSPLLAALNQLDLSLLRSRTDADRQLARSIPAPQVRAFLLQNLVKDGDGFRWRINLPVITASMGSISGFPDVGGRVFAGRALFVRGGDSDYIQEHHLPAIEALFPAARVETVNGASHWLHHERPERITRIIEDFIRGDAS